MGNKYKILPETGLKNPTRQQWLFIDAYMRTFNIGKAGIAAGYVPGADRKVYNLPHVKAVIDIKKEEYLESLGYSRERVIAEICKQAFADIGDFIEWSTTFNSETQRYQHSVRVKDSSEIDTSVLKAVKINKEGKLEIEMCDKQAALDKLSKFLGLNAADKVEVTGAEGGSIKIEDLRGKLIEKISKLVGSVESESEDGNTTDSVTR